MRLMISIMIMVYDHDWTGTISTIGSAWNMFVSIRFQLHAFSNSMMNGFCFNTMIRFHIPSLSLMTTLVLFSAMDTLSLWDDMVA